MDYNQGSSIGYSCVSGSYMYIQTDLRGLYGNGLMCKLFFNNEINMF